MLVVALALALLWALVVLVVVGLCASAARGDTHMQARAQRARMRLIA